MLLKQPNCDFTQRPTEELLLIQYFPPFQVDESPSDPAVTHT